MALCRDEDDANGIESGTTRCQPAGLHQRDLAAHYVGLTAAVDVNHDDALKKLVQSSELCIWLLL